MIKKLILIIIITLLLTGCNNYTELSDLGIINIMGIDKQDSGYKITLSMVTPSPINDDNDEIYTIYEATGNTISEAIQNIYLKTDQKIYLSHLKVLLLEEEIAKEDISFIIDYFLRNNETRNTFLPIITKETTTNEVINMIDDSHKIPELIKINSNEYGIVSIITFEDFVKIYLKENQDNLLPSIKIDDEKLEIDSYAYFQNKVLKGYLSKEDSLIYNLLTNNTTNLNLTTSCDDNYIEGFLNNPTASIDLTSEINISIKGQLTIEENTCQTDSKETIKLLEETLLNKIKLFVSNMHTNNSDYLGIKDLIIKNNYQNDYKFNIETDLNILENNDLRKDN